MGSCKVAMHEPGNHTDAKIVDFNQFSSSNCSIWITIQRKYVIGSAEYSVQVNM
jgi:hypothetical protein